MRRASSFFQIEITQNTVCSLPMSTTESDWKSIHSTEESWRKKIIGDINEAFVVPRYVSLFYNYFGKDQGLNIIELGSGQGDLSSAIVQANKGQIGKWTGSEYFPEGVAWLQKRGFHAIQASACDTKLPNESFDVSVSLDVMHHVDDQRAMARELLRIAKGRTLLVESNGLSIPRKLMELTEGHRKAGERSFTPWAYKSFFEGHGYEITRFDIAPFLFPFRVPGFLLKPLVWFNHAIEYIPFFKWQCSSVYIYIEYKKNEGSK